MMVVKKKSKKHKTLKRKLKFKHYNCFEAIQLENKIKNLEKKYEIDINSPNNQS